MTFTDSVTMIVATAFLLTAVSLVIPFVFWLHSKMD
jgi:hypothetical protein